MKQLKWQFLVVTILLVPATVALAQGQGHSNGMRNYDPKTEATVKGTVEDVQHPGKGAWTGTHLVLKTDSESLEVHAGQSAYIAEKQFTFAKGDKIEVFGSRVKLGGVNALLAREITKDGKTLVLRDAQGIPQWSRRNRPVN